jgi:triacylglycerol lipase
MFLVLGRMHLRLSRRELVQRGAMTGVSGAVLPGLLAACGGSTPAPTVLPSSTPGTPRAAQSAGPTVPAATSAKLTTPDAGDTALPILFVHGNGDSSALWITTLWRFESNGYPRERLFTIDYPNPTARDDNAVAQPSRSGTDEQRAQLAAKVDEVLAQTGAAKLVLVGNSRGANSIRNFVKHGGSAKVASVLPGGGVNHGVFNTPGNNSEFNGAGRFLQELNAGSEVVPGVAFMTIRSDTLDKYAQPLLASGAPSNISYDAPELHGATNVVLDGIDHRETAFSPRAFAEMFRFITGRTPSTVITPEKSFRLSGSISGFEYKVPTNRGVAGIIVTVYMVDPATGARVGGPVHQSTTGPDGSWGSFTAQPTAPYEFVMQQPGNLARHIFRSPFPRSSAVVSFRLAEDATPPNEGLIIFTRPRGYIATGRDKHLLDGAPVPGVKKGVPTDSAFKVPFTGPERGVLASLNGEALAVRTIPGEVVYAEFHY